MPQLKEYIAQRILVFPCVKSTTLGNPFVTFPNQPSQCQPCSLASSAGLNSIVSLSLQSIPEDPPYSPELHAAKLLSHRAMTEYEAWSHLDNNDERLMS